MKRIGNEVVVDVIKKYGVTRKNNVMGGPLAIQNQPNYKNRVINLFSGFTSDKCNTIMEQLLSWEEEDAEIIASNMQLAKPVQNIEYTLKPIIININSPGGNVDDLLAIVDLLRSMYAPVITRGFGQMCSAGFVLFCAGDERYVGPNCTLMYHTLSYGTWGKMADISDYAAYNEKVQKRMDDIIVSNTGLTHEILTSWKRQDVWLDAEDAIKLGVAHDMLYRFEEEVVEEPKKKKASNKKEGKKETKSKKDSKKKKED